MKLSLGIENLSSQDQIDILKKELSKKEYLMDNLSETDLPYESEVIEWINSDGNKKVVYTTTSDFVEASCILNNEIYLIKQQITQLQDMLIHERKNIFVENNYYSFSMDMLQLQPSF
jgi:hypothetical protein